MIRKILLIISCTIVCNNNVVAQSLTSKQIVGVKNAANGFMSAVAIYSNCHGIEYAPKKYYIFGLTTEIRGTDLMFNDLREFKFNDDTSANLILGTYIDKIREDFNFDIYMETPEIENTQVLKNCIVKDGNNRYAYASMEKTISYKNQTNTYKIIIAVNISNPDNYTIQDVVSQKFFISDPEHLHSTCNIGTFKTEVNDQQLLDLRTKAEKYFSNKDFLTAKNIYISILQMAPTDSIIKTRIEECNKSISYNTIYTNAQEQYNNKNYKTAKNLYSQLYKFKTADKEFITKRIELCDQGIKENNFQQLIGIADFYYKVVNFEKAGEYYQQALIIKPNDSYVLSQIQKSRNGDKTFVKQELARAVKLAESGRKNYAEAFRIMSEYEPSGLLTTDNYAFLTLMMFSKNREIRQKLDYTNDDFKNYFNIYVKKLYEINGVHPSHQATFLLDEVINKRYQK